MNWETPEMMTVEEIDSGERKWEKCPVCGVEFPPGQLDKHGCTPVYQS